MELFAGLIVLVIVVAALIFFRNSVKEVASVSEKVIGINAAEVEKDIIFRVNKLADELKEAGPLRYGDLKGLLESSNVKPVEKAKK